MLTVLGSNSRRRLRLRACRGSELLPSDCTRPSVTHVCYGFVPTAALSCRLLTALGSYWCTCPAAMCLLQL